MRPPSNKELRHLLVRLSRKLPERIKLLETNNSRNIKLGLERVKYAVPQSQSWQGLHVAGTNGKGSICAYLSGLFSLTDYSYGRYTSPAFPEKRHGVTINGEVLRQTMYDGNRSAVLNRYAKVHKGLQATSAQDPGALTPFEIDTATAFQIFEQLKVSYGIVEVGMGGATDATNVMKDKAVTIISKIGIDHAEYLGRNLTDIAAVKAGIMARDVPCIVDHTNQPEVLQVLKQHARRVGSRLILSSQSQGLLSGVENDIWQLEDWQQQNLLCAVTAFKTVFPNESVDLNKVLSMNPSLPGRMQTVKISSTTDDGEDMTALVDGAHNPLATQSLARYVDRNLRKKREPVTWVIGFSQSDTKPFKQMLQDILRPQDSVAFVEFSRRADDPPPVAAEIGRPWALDCLDKTRSDQAAPAGTSLEQALEWARQKSECKHPVVITGSLYLMRDVLNLPNVKGKALEYKERSVGSTTYKALRKKKVAEGLTDEELEIFREGRRQYHLRKDQNRLLRGTKATKEKAVLDAHFEGSIEELGTYLEPAEIKPTPKDSNLKAAQRKKTILRTPFWQDPENPSMSLPKVYGQPSRRKQKRAANAAKEAGRKGHDESAGSTQRRKKRGYGVRS
ncbi:Mur ligase [Sarocladium strictum]|jgi:folylpolyglutamate synthase